MDSSRRKNALAGAVGGAEGLLDEFAGPSTSDLDFDAGAFVHLHVKLLLAVTLPHRLHQLLLNALH